MSKRKPPNKKNQKTAKRSSHDGHQTGLFVITDIDASGAIWLQKKGGSQVGGGKKPIYRLLKEPDQGAALQKGQMVLAYLHHQGDEKVAIAKRALPMREKSQDSHKKTGRDKNEKPKYGHVSTTNFASIEVKDKGIFLHPISRGKTRSFFIKNSNIIGIKETDIPLENNEIICFQMDETTRSNQKLRIEARIGKADEAKIFSTLAIYEHSLISEFSHEVIKEAQELKPINDMGNREDFTHLPFITIDDETARDFDDAVMAETLPEGGHRLYIAIADVAHYVKSNTTLDKEAKARGNSVYFPDRVLPMLPEALSNELCSLKPHEQRPCLCVVIEIDDDGQMQNYKFHLVMIKSHARLTYNQVEDALYHDQVNAATKELLLPVLQPLKKAWQALLKARERRHALAIISSEIKVVLNESGVVENLVPRVQLNSHRLIEDFMIAANVAAARFLDRHCTINPSRAGLYRIHDPPPADKLESLWEDLTNAGLNIPKAFQPTTQSFNHMIHKLADEVARPLVSMAILRSQSQACYQENLAPHFGLALTHYTHFTSPIRRYADLTVHRALIQTLWPDGGVESRNEEPLGAHLSICERRAQMAERDTIGRYQAHFLSKYEDQILAAVVTGIKPFGLFVRLKETGAEGLALFTSNRHERRFRGGKKRDDKKSPHKLGDQVKVTIRELTPLAGGILFRLE